MSRNAVALLVGMVLIHGPASPAGAQETQTDLSVQLTGPATPVPVPEEVRLTATVTNLGSEEASGLELGVSLPDSLVPMSVQQGPWSCSSTLACSLDTLPGGSTAEVGMAVAAVAPGSLAVGAAIGHSAADPDPSNDLAAIVVKASGRPCDAVGTAGPDTLRARRPGEVACGLRGDDVLLGGSGRQALFGGAGRDALGGGPGRDRLDGGSGRDACDPKGRGCEVPSFASASSLPLFETSRRTVGYGYHQSLFGTAIGMRPLVPHRVMGSRGRGTGPTTAVDIVLPSRSGVRSPVTGTVVAVKRYLLYCRTRDWKVVLAPRSHPRLRVLVLHMARPAVREGDEVRAGSTLLGRAAHNDQPSAQANRYFPDPYPHVHVEIERNRASPTPGCRL